MLKFTKTIAGNTDLLTSQAFVSSQENIGLAILISASGEDVFTVVRQNVLQEQSEFFDSPGILSKRISSLLQVLIEKLSSLDDVQILIASWKEDDKNLENPGTALYLQSVGTNDAYLLRDGSLTRLTTGNDNGELISGYLKPGDKLFLSTQSFIENRDETNLRKLITIPPEDLEDESQSFLLEHSKVNPLAAILIDYPFEVSRSAISVNGQEEEEKKKEKEEESENFFPNFDPTPSLSESKPSLNRFRLPRSILKFPPLPTGKKRIAIIASTLIVLLLVSAIFIFFPSRNILSGTNIEASVSEARNKYNEALTLKDSDPQRARETLSQANNLLNEALAKSPQSQSAKNLKQEIDNSSQDILKEYRISDWSPFLDLNLIKSGFSPKRVSISLNRALLLDENQKTLVSIDLVQKNHQILAGSNQLGRAVSASINGDFAFAFSPDKGVIKIDTQNPKPQSIIKPDPEWGVITDIYGFGNNIYLLDPSKHQIWKYVPILSGYSEKTEYMRSSVDLSGSSRMQIDSSIWVLKNNSEIEKFTQGNPDNFAVSGLEKPILSISAFFIADTTENLYLIDSGSSRLVVLKKTGEYLAQYLSDKWATTTDLFVDEKNKKIYILESGKIFQTALK